MTPPLTHSMVRDTLTTYCKAWSTQDPDLILTIFTPDATYQEGPFAIPMKGHEEIKRYWETKVVSEQSDIKASVTNIIIEGNAAVAEWMAYFNDLVKKERVELYEVAFLTFADGKIASLKETWRSRRTPL